MLSRGDHVVHLMLSCVVDVSILIPGYVLFLSLLFTQIPSVIFRQAQDGIFPSQVSISPRPNDITALLTKRFGVEL